MYNRYIPNGNSYTRVTEQEPLRIPTPPKSGKEPPPPPCSHPPSTPLQSRKNMGPVSFLDTLGLNEPDSGDILLLLILLFLFRDGDDVELLITLGLVLLIGLGDKQKNADR